MNEWGFFGDVIIWYELIEFSMAFTENCSTKKGRLKVTAELAGSTIL